MSRRFKRVVAVSDLHCGHIVGLTPPEWWTQALPTAYLVQRAMWEFYTATLEALQPIDALLVLGDCLDGKGSKSGGTEQITTDMRAQVIMAEGALRQAKARKIVMVHGTPYHVGPDGEDWEAVLADRLGAVISGHEWAEAHGIVFDLKHHIGGSQIEHGRHTAISRDRLANLLWADRQGAPRAHILLRGHVHYFAGASGPDWRGFTMPALQGPGSKFGVRRCSGLVHFGLLQIDIPATARGAWDVTVKPHIMHMEAACPKPVKL